MFPTAQNPYANEVYGRLQREESKLGRRVNEKERRAIFKAHMATKTGVTPMMDFAAWQALIKMYPIVPLPDSQRFTQGEYQRDDETRRLVEERAAQRAAFMQRGRTTGFSDVSYVPPQRTAQNWDKPRTNVTGTQGGGFRERQRAQERALYDPSGRRLRPY